MDDSSSNAINQTSTASPDAIERARLRRNQRNSRARKQAYIQDLEQRWGKCVELGAQATMEMQKEAQRVHEENRLLRKALHNQGLDDATIERALEAAKSASCAVPAPPQVREGLITDELPAVSWSNIDSAGEHPSMAAVPSTGVENPQVVGETDIPQTLDLFDWLDNLSQIKDAFGAESFDDLFDYSAVPLESSDFIGLNASMDPYVDYTPSSTIS
ncbi:uncharacterized protein LY89DRAFT_674427 [Mollisia scopiformis]|uniref:BZIP domain-containing protein n=1 Tax=Mollisia scopiformis TaxID=149040 RepID=A0A194WTZ0_MOLSC|nr:uncharacterized protein LY89DRAFT_674427 [Mollisia scopiformis]KUJ11077.1 hypothetical protein LY89DRAFT_674427 [Mollisia scopiformis]